MTELIQDYPVGSYITKSGKKVKAHERNIKGKLQKEIILLKVEKLKREREKMLIQDEDEWAMVHFGRSEPYPTYKEYLKREKKRLGLDLIQILTPVVDLVEDSDDGRWITMRGTHVFVKKGQSPKEALKTLLTKSKIDKWKRDDWKKAQREKDKFANKEIDRREKYGWKKEKLYKELAKTKKDSKEWITLIDKIEALRWKEKQRRREKAESDKQERGLSESKKTGKVDLIHVLTPVITSVIRRNDSIPFSEFKEIKTDFKDSDFVIFHGPIARDGPYDYTDENGNTKTLYKDIDNLKDIYSRYNYLPMKTSEIPGAHFAEEFGYATNFSVNEETNEIEADLILVNDGNFQKILSMKDEYHVSPGYNDNVIGNIQMLTDVDHIALALGPEIGRACSGTNSKGASCTIVEKIHDQNLTEVVYN